MGGHIIIRGQMRATLEEPLNNAALPDVLRTIVNAILAKSNPDWSHAECYILGAACAAVACDNPNS